MLGQLWVDVDPDDFEVPGELELPELVEPDPLDVVGVALEDADPRLGVDELLVEAVAAEIPRPRLKPTAVTAIPAIA